MPKPYPKHSESINPKPKAKQQQQHRSPSQQQQHPFEAHRARLRAEADKAAATYSPLTPPPNWPSSLTYLTHSIPSPLLPSSLAAIHCAEHTSTHPRAIILPITTSTPSVTNPHPALHQAGLFAPHDLPPRSLVVPYLGVVHTEEESDEQSEYDLRLWSDGVPLGIDATHSGNEARFANDYRGILPRPNVEFADWEAQKPDGRGTVRGLALYTLKTAIPRGTELCVSYGKGWWAARRAEQQDEDDEGERYREKKDNAPQAAPINSIVEAQLQRSMARLGLQAQARPVQRPLANRPPREPQ